MANQGKGMARRTVTPGTQGERSSTVATGPKAVVTVKKKLKVPADHKRVVPKNPKSGKGTAAMTWG